MFYLHHGLDLRGAHDDAADVDELADGGGLNVPDGRGLRVGGGLEGHLVATHQLGREVVGGGPEDGKRGVIWL